MKILLTGATGFLGKRIFADLVKLNEVDTLSRSGGTYTVDLSVTKPVLDKDYEMVIHSSGKAHFVPKTVAEEQLFFEVNVTGTQNLLDALTDAGTLPRSFVYISSVAVYGQHGLNIDEDMPLEAKDAYGISKIQAERLVEQWCLQHQVICTILRLPLLAGPNPPGNLGALIKGIKKGYYFNISGGLAKKSIVMTADVSAILMKAGLLGGVYNLTDGIGITFTDLSASVARQLGKPMPRNMNRHIALFVAKIGDILGRKAPINTEKLHKITSDLTFDDTKARKVLDWNPGGVLENFKIK